MRYKIIPVFDFQSETIEANSPEEALVDFATVMDTNMGIYFRAIPEDEVESVLAEESENIKMSQFNYNNETVEFWLEQFDVANKSNEEITAEIQDIAGTISNERLFQKGSDTQEQVNMHEQNISNLLEYKSSLEMILQERDERLQS